MSSVLSECHLLLGHTREIVSRSESHVNWAIAIGLTAVGVIIAVAALLGVVNYWSLSSQVSELKDRVAKQDAKIKFLEDNQYFTFDSKTGSVRLKGSIAVPDE